MSNVVEIIDYYESGKRLTSREMKMLIEHIYNLWDEIEKLNKGKYDPREITAILEADQFNKRK